MSFFTGGVFNSEERLKQPRISKTTVKMFDYGTKSDVS